MQESQAGSLVFKWITGAVGAMLLVGMSFLLAQITGKFSSQDSAITEMRNQIAVVNVTIASMGEKLRQVDILADYTRKEQIDRTGKVSSIDAKLGTFEVKIQHLNDRFSAISERLLSINQRLDKIGENVDGIKKQKFEVKDLYYPIPESGIRIE